jgi:hypothetical protein
MPLDFLSVKQQIRELAAEAPAELKRLNGLRQQAGELLAANAGRLDELRDKIAQAAALDSFLRAAKPTMEELTSAHPLPAAPAKCTLIAADGSQINPSRHEALNYALINLGAITMLPGSGQAPGTHTRTELHYAEYRDTGSLSEEQVGLERDKAERVLLAELAAAAQTQPAITLTDGPLELWGGRGRDAESQAGFARSLDDYLAALKALHLQGAITAGYVDKPRADLVVRALEVAMTPLDQLGDIRQQRPLRGVTDTDLFGPLLGPGQRSALFAIQAQLAHRYEGPLALHFFYLNVGIDQPWLARVEVPAWVAEDPTLLNALHAILIEQCRVLGGLSYPYALHRAHEIALVIREEKEQVTQMLLAELAAQGVATGAPSHKQAVKDLPGRGRS